MPNWFGRDPKSNLAQDPWGDEDDEGTDHGEYRPRQGQISRPAIPRRGERHQDREGLDDWGVFGVISLILALLLFFGCSASWVFNPVII